jgi:hypothetical protein
MAIDWDKTLTYWVGTATVVQAVVAVVMVRGLRHAKAQAAATTATLAVMEANTERQLRAYVALLTAEATPRVAGQPLEIKFDVFNGGQTPANNVRVISRWGIVPLAQLEDFDLEPQAPGEEESVSRISAGAQIGTLHQVPAADWAPFAPVLDAGQARVVLVGKVTYDDIFGKARITRFRLQLVPTYHPTQLVSCKTGNDAT